MSTPITSKRAGQASAVGSPTILPKPVTAASSAECQPSLARDAFRKLFSVRFPETDREFRRALVMATLIGRQMEAEDLAEINADAPPAQG